MNKQKELQAVINISRAEREVSYVPLATTSIQRELLVSPSSGFT